MNIFFRLFPSLYRNAWNSASLEKSHWLPMFAQLREILNSIEHIILTDSNNYDLKVLWIFFTRYQNNTAMFIWSDCRFNFACTGWPIKHVCVVLVPCKTWLYGSEHYASRVTRYQNNTDMFIWSDCSFTFTCGKPSLQAFRGLDKQWCGCWVLF